ncbi:MAG: DEAD/DEAH box helicase, partial [Chlamydiia bacterium]|nr:DEAD/DEAH box helicase [Chlamydiia bacterium]
NHLRELKTLFDLVLPGYMPDETAYREHFIKPIERDPGSERKHLLNRLVQPFVMRRKKEDVLDDLPEKTEEIAHCELTSEQHLLYQRAVIEQNALKEALRDSSQPIPYLHVFALLTSLKQICNHPALYLKEPENYVKHPSGKWNLFIELLHEALDSSQKVVVFTQYLQMLDIFELYLQQQEIPYAVIRGSTKERGAELERFNQDLNCKVFLGSLQAVGLGIDLTAASVVIHYDRWWNAAREEQATDRVHRIGQQRGVQVFKLVTLGTFEERIDEMIRQKGGLMEDVIGTDQRDLFKKLSREEILNLLKIEF